jgi:hypothetical protein
MTDRIAEIRAEAEGAIAAATDTHTLEDIRVRYLGRKAELPNGPSLSCRRASAPPPGRRRTRHERHSRPPSSGAPTSWPRTSSSNAWSATA